MHAEFFSESFLRWTRSCIKHCISKGTEVFRGRYRWVRARERWSESCLLVGYPSHGCHSQKFLKFPDFSLTTPSFPDQMNKQIQKLVFDVLNRPPPPTPHISPRCDWFLLSASHVECPWIDKKKCVLLKFHFILTSSKDLNFPLLKVKFSDFYLPLKNNFP